jgi:hypothetical protein
MAGKVKSLYQRPAEEGKRPKRHPISERVHAEENAWSARATYWFWNRWWETNCFRHAMKR